VWLVLWVLTGGLTVALASLSPLISGVLPGIGVLYGLLTVLGPFTGYAGPLFGFEASALKPVVMVVALAFVPLFVAVFRWFGHVKVLAPGVFALYVVWAVLWFVIGVGYVVTTVPTY
jgi:hypothetical protein